MSVVVSTYIAQEFIGATIRSAANQTNRNWGLLNIDDCSTEGPGDLVRSLAGQDGGMKS